MHIVICTVYDFHLCCLFRRGLRFIQILLQSLADGERDEQNPNLIRINITKAYDQALKRYHGWIVQKVFKVSVFCSFCGHGNMGMSICFPCYEAWKSLVENYLVNLLSTLCITFFFFKPSYHIQLEKSLASGM